MMVEPLRVTFKSRKCVVVEGFLKLFQVFSLLVFGGIHTPKMSSM